MAYQSFLADVQARLNAARDAALVAAGEVVRTAVKEGVRGGYKTGAFVTGQALNSVKITGPEDTEAGRAVRVYSDLDYMLFWEVGHQNLFSGKFERKEVWFPALMSTTGEQLAAFNRVFARFMGQSA